MKNNYYIVPKEIYDIKDKSFIFNNKKLKVEKLYNLCNICFYIKDDYNCVVLSRDYLLKTIGYLYRDYIKYLQYINYLTIHKNYSYQLGLPRKYYINKIDLEVVVVKNENYIDKNKYRNDNIKVSKNLVSNLNKIEIDFKKIELTMDAEIEHKKAMKQIMNGDMDYTFDKYGRFHTPFTRLKSEYRKFILINGNKTCEVDMKKSHPFILKQIMLSEGVIDELYFNSIEDNSIYERLRFDNYDPKDIFMTFLNGRNSEYYSKNNVGLFNRKVKQIYPLTYSFWTEYKRKIKPIKGFHLLQYIESEIIFNEICFELYKLYPNIILTTIHDSIIVEKKYEKVARELMEKSRRELNNEKIVGLIDKLKLQVQGSNDQKNK